MMIDVDVVSFSCGTGTLHRPSFSASSYQRLFLSSDAIAAFLAANSNRRNNDTSNASEWRKQHRARKSIGSLEVDGECVGDGRGA